MVDIADTILVSASRDQWIQSIRNHAANWGPPLDEQQYLERCVFPPTCH